MNQPTDDAMGRVAVEVTLGNNHEIVLAEVEGRSRETVRQVQLPGIVDTGASRLVLPERVVQQLGLPSAGEGTVRYADQRTATRPLVKNVWLKLQGREGIFSAVVEPNREDALIGAIVMEELDFLVDCTTQTLRPRDPDRIVTEIE